LWKERARFNVTSSRAKLWAEGDIGLPRFEKKRIVQQGKDAAIVTAINDEIRGEALAAAANSSEEFASAARWFDGALVITVGKSSTWYKIYSGQIIDVARGRGVFGYTFEVSGQHEDWLEALEAERVDLQRLLVERKVVVSGNLLEFLRIGRAVDILVEEMGVLYRRGKKVDEERDERDG
jgi:hypothetical protein